MTRLILTFTDSSARALKSARLADCVVGVGLRFVWGKLPSAHELDLLLSPRSAMPEVSASRWSDHLTGERIADARSRGLGLIEFAEPFEAIEIWVGPEPNSQLQLVWLLNYLQPHADLVSRLTLVQVDASIGDLLLDELSRWRSQAAPIRNDALESAGAAWAAWRAPTPESWFDLLARDLETLPRLRETVISLLEELPMPGSGLGATEMRMLELVAPGRVHSFDVFPGYEKPNNRRVFSYWELGSLLDGLAHCPAPALSGLDEGPFTPAMHDDPARYQRYRQSTLSLTPLGEAILAGADDFSRHNPVHRWWGGTELINEQLWRWDPIDRTLVKSGTKL